ENVTILQKDQLAQIGLEVGDEFNCYLEKSIGNDINYTLNIANVYKYCPRFYVQEPREGTVFRFTAIVNYSLIDDLAYSKFTIRGDMLVKVDPNYDITEVAEAIEIKLGRSVDDVGSLMKTFGDSLRNTMLYGSLNTLFLSSMIITIAAITLMIYIQSLENEMELTLLKTIGMSPKQLFSMFTIEAITLVLFGSVLGFFVGLFSVSMFLEILTLDNIIPPDRVIFQPGQIILAFGILFIISISSAAITSWIIFRKDTIKGIKNI
ncbi:MAG: ABC transporter permease, partial [Asgard group archaeon]|nr:ABC transporter permease [Asgard group archaeon]